VSCERTVEVSVDVPVVEAVSFDRKKIKALAAEFSTGWADLKVLADELKTARVADEMDARQCNVRTALRVVGDSKSAEVQLEISATLKDLSLKFDHVARMLQDLDGMLKDGDPLRVVAEACGEVETREIPETDIDVPFDVQRVLHREGLITTNDLGCFSLSQLFELLTEL